MYSIDRSSIFSYTKTCLSVLLGVERLAVTARSVFRLQIVRIWKRHIGRLIELAHLFSSECECSRRHVRFEVLERSCADNDGGNVGFLRKPSQRDCRHLLLQLFRDFL